MARDINNPMLHKEAVAYFEEWILPLLVIEEAQSQGGEWKWVDECHRSETWNNPIVLYPSARLTQAKGMLKVVNESR